MNDAHNANPILRVQNKALGIFYFEPTIDPRVWNDSSRRVPQVWYNGTESMTAAPMPMRSILP
jgi:hypothetical protein